jgi:phage baseplate assembly protein W
MNTKYRGLMYPLEVKDGQLRTTSDLEIVEQNIIQVLETRPTERVMRVDYGWDPKIFNTLEPNAINARIHRAVTKQVKGVSALIVDGRIDTADQGTYQVTLKYKVNGVPAPPLNLSLNM